MYGYEEFSKDVFRLTGIDLSLYKERQMKRRIEALIARHKLSGFQDFVGAIKTDKDLYEDFLSYLTINVSEFYRNPVQWKTLENTMLPRLLQKTNGRPLKVWSAACSTGDEPYSLVMLLAKSMPIERVTVDATDIDKQILEKAQQGIYNGKSLKGLPDEYKKKYFEQIGRDSFKISDDVKKRVKFRQHNLLADKYQTGYDLILCRNVMIYFTEEAKEEIYRNFYKSLTPGGVLFVGSTEQMIHSDEIGFKSEASFFYIKP
ncbi:MAG: protein-glutamate O-methyltransferase CheR [Lachnospiraceae bacterium]|nr:protein-glutamate O-methyltransferase CheR [Lachnospiraceae bacterium]